MHNVNGKSRRSQSKPTRRLRPKLFGSQASVDYRVPDPKQLEHNTGSDNLYQFHVELSQRICFMEERSS